MKVNNIGIILSSLIEKNGLTTNAVAKTVGLGRGNFYLILDGKRRISGLLAYRLQDCFKFINAENLLRAQFEIELSNIKQKRKLKKKPSGYINKVGFKKYKNKKCKYKRDI